MDTVGYLLWAASLFVALVLIVAGAHHVGSPRHLADARARQRATGTLPWFALTETRVRAIGVVEIAVGVAAPTSMLTPAPIRIVVATAIILIGAAFVTVTLASRRSTASDCGCLPLAAGETPTTALPALGVLAAGLAMATAVAVTAPSDQVGWEMAGGVQGALGALWLLHYAAASARVDRVPDLSVPGLSVEAVRR